MRIPYIKLQQRSETFYVSKFNLLELLEHLNFHFREPYQSMKNNIEVVKYQKYIQQISRKGIELRSSEEGIQRRLQIDRINDIKKFIESDNDNFLPNSVLLSADVSELEDFEDNYLRYEDETIGYFEFPDNFMFSIIDGQHRLAGLSLVEKEVLEEFEVAAIILLNTSKPTAAKLFADINGKQKSVNKSLIYDLYSELDDKSYQEIKKYHIICESFYTAKESPLFRQIKMLGIGSGAISQAFFIDYVKEAITKTNLVKASTQEIYNHLFYYFRSYQKTFPDDWPVPVDFTKLDQLISHSNNVLKVRKSQLVKTNGFGAIVRIFPEIYENTNGNYKNYFSIVSKLGNRINWIPNETTGTGKAFQNSLVKMISKILNL